VATAAEASHGGIRRSPPDRRSHHGGIHGARRRLHGPSALPPSPLDLKCWSPRARGCLPKLGLPGLFFELLCRLSPSLQQCLALAITSPCPCLGAGPCFQTALRWSYGGAFDGRLPCGQTPRKHAGCMQNPP
jgi:hypothetical protein